MEKERVHHGKDGGIGADTQRQRDHRNGYESRGLAHGAQRVTNVLADVSHRIFLCRTKNRQGPWGKKGGGKFTPASAGEVNEEIRQHGFRIPSGLQLSLGVEASNRPCVLRSSAGACWCWRRPSRCPLAGQKDRTVRRTQPRGPGAFWRKE